MKRILTILTCAACAVAYGQKFEGLALTPQMGWNSWNKFQGRVSEVLIREIADAMATNGMKAAGYEYVNIDDLWHSQQRDTNGNIHADATRFPSGIKALADYVHSKGLKIGIYSDAGARTCGGRPGSRDHELQDAKTYAEWGIDYLKYDWCNTQGLQAPAAYKKMSDALRAAGRPILFSLCEWGNTKPWTWGKDIGHSWRTTGDIWAKFDGINDHGSYKDWGVLQILDMQNGLREFAGPGHWNDPDMLEVGNGMSVNEDRAHFSMWCMLAAPLISGNDLRNMPKTTLDILTNPDVIAVDQDTLGIQGFKYSAKDGLEIWFKPLKDNAWAFCALNRSTNAQEVTFAWKNEKVTDAFAKRDAQFDKVTYRVRDLWTKADRGSTQEPLVATVPGHDVLMLKLTSGPAGSAAAPKVIRIRAGASEPLTDSSGNVWLADQGFVDGETFARANDLSIANTKDPALYRAERYSMTAFAHPLPNGKYTVKLHFAETFEEITAAGGRVFTVNVEGREFKDFDVFAKAGGAQRAYVETVPVEINDGKLDIKFTSNVQNPAINGIEIIPGN